MFMSDETTINDIVGHNIRLAREAAGLSQEQLARVLGKDRRMVSRWELGGGISEPNLRKLAATLDIPFLSFYQGDV